MTEFNLTRRGFLAHGIRGVGVVTVAGAMWPALGAQEAIAQGPLTAQRAATYYSVVMALALAPSTLVSGDRVDVAVSELESWHAGLADDQQAHVNAILDLVESAGKPPFSQLSPVTARGFLRAWAAERTPAEAALDKLANQGRLDQPGGQAPRDEMIAWLQEQSKAIAATRQAIADAHGADALELDPETGLQRYQPPQTVVALPQWPVDERSDAALHRYLVEQVRSLAALPFYDRRMTAPL